MFNGKKIFNSDFGEEEVHLPQSLSAYANSDNLLKFKVLLINIFIEILYVLLVIMFTVLFVVHQKNPIYVPYFILLLSSTLIACFSHFLLYKGHYNVSSNIMLVDLFATVWVATLMNKSITIEQIDNVVYVFSLLFFLPLIIQKKRTAVLITILNIGMLFFLFRLNYDKITALGGNGYNSFFDCVIAFVISGALIIFTNSVYQSVIRKQWLYISRIKDVSKRLEASEKKHNNFIEDFPEIFFRTNSNGDLIYLNKAGYNALKISKNDFDKGINVLNALSDFGRSRLYESVNKATEGFRSKGGEFVMTFGKNKFNLQLYVSPIIENDKLQGVEGLAIDIADRKRAEIEQKRSEELLRSVIEDSPNIVVLCDIKGKILLVNRTFLEHSKLSYTEVKGRLLSKFDFLAHLYSIDLRDEVLRKGTINSIEYKFLNENNEDEYFRYTCKLMHFRGQQIIYISVVNITNHKRVEEEIRKREEMLSMLLKAMPNMVMLADEDATIEWCNDELLRLAGFEANQVVGRSVYDVFLNKTSYAKGFIANEIHKNGFMLNKEVTAVDYRGISYTVLLSSVQVLYNNKPMYLSVIVDTTDKAKAEKELNSYRMNLESLVQERTESITTINKELADMNKKLTAKNLEVENKNCELENALEKLKNAQEQLIQSEKMTSLGLLASGIAHEINNPLNYIKGGILGIENYFYDNNCEALGEVRPLIDAVNEGVDRASNIVKGVSRYSHTSDCNDEICDIHMIIDSSIILLHTQINNNLKIEKNYTGKMLLIKGNEGKLHQVFVNIIQNAIHAIDKDGIISITTDETNGNAIIQISDNGCGIPLKVMKHIFDPFFTTKEPGKGSGLGLTISYGIILEHNGTLSYTSNEGLGTTATIQLPLWVENNN